MDPVNQSAPYRVSANPQVDGAIDGAINHRQPAAAEPTAPVSDPDGPQPHKKRQRGSRGKGGGKGKIAEQAEQLEPALGRHHKKNRAKESCQAKAKAAQAAAITDNSSSSSSGSVAGDTAAPQDGGGAVEDVATGVAELLPAGESETKAAADAHAAAEAKAAPEEGNGAPAEPAPKDGNGAPAEPAPEDSNGAPAEPAPEEEDGNGEPAAPAAAQDGNRKNKKLATAAKVVVGAAVVVVGVLIVVGAVGAAVTALCAHSAVGVVAHGGWGLAKLGVRLPVGALRLVFHGAGAVVGTASGVAACARSFGRRGPC